MFELSKKKNLLLKAQTKSLSSAINSIEVIKDRIFVSMISNSVQIYKYISSEKTFYQICEDILPRWTSVCMVIDQNTFIAGDKYDNIYVCKIPPSNIVVP